MVLRLGSSRLCLAPVVTAHRPFTLWLMILPQQKTLRSRGDA